MDKTLTVKDCKGLVEDLHEVCDTPEALGILLNLPQSTLDEIFARRSRSWRRFFEVISNFVEHEEQRPTWRIILNALRNPLINNPRLAERIEMRLSDAAPTQQGKA